MIWLFLSLIHLTGFLTGLSYLFGVVVHHAGGVIHRQTNLVLSLAGLGPPQPDLVFTELTGDVGDHLPHVQTFPCAVITSVEQWNITHTHLTTLCSRVHSSPCCNTALALISNEPPGVITWDKIRRKQVGTGTCNLVTTRAIVPGNNKWASNVSLTTLHNLKPSIITQKVLSVLVLTWVWRPVSAPGWGGAAHTAAGRELRSESGTGATWKLLHSPRTQTRTHQPQGTTTTWASYNTCSGESEPKQ